MRCKIGDLAVIVRAKVNTQHIGRMVRIVGQIYDDIGPLWETIPKLHCRKDGCGLAWDDSSLRPIRDNPGEDEMLRLVGKPERESA